MSTLFRQVTFDYDDYASVQGAHLAAPHALVAGASLLASYSW